MAKIYKSVEELIGNTPLLELTKIEKGTGAFELARLLGLKSPVTLEKYYKT